MSGTTNIPCCYLLLRREGKVLFVLRQNTGFQDGDFGLIAGHVEAGESFRDGIVREALEEIGLAIETSTLKHVHTMHRFQSTENTRVDVFFEVTDWEGEVINNEPTKHSEITWFELNNLPSNVQDFTAHALGQISKGNTYSEFGWSS